MYVYLSSKIVVSAKAVIDIFISVLFTFTIATLKPNFTPVFILITISPTPTEGISVKVRKYGCL